MRCAVAAPAEIDPSWRVRFRAVIGLAFFIVFGYGLIVPTLPLFASRFGVKEAGVGLLLTVFAGARLVADFFAGSLIDRHGERAMAAIGAGIVGVSSVAAGAAPNYPALVVLRGFGGFGSAFFLGALMANLIGTVPATERGRAMSTFQGAVGISFILGPVFGGLIAAVAGLRAPLFVYGGICLAGVPLCAAVLNPHPGSAAGLAEAPTAPEEPLPGPTIPAWQRLRPLLKDSAYVAALIGGGILFFESAALDTLISRYWRFRLLQPGRTVGIPFTIFGIAGIAAIWHAGRLSDARGRKFALVPALAVMALCTGALGFARSPALFVLVLAALGLASSYQRPGPTAMVADVAPPGSRGVAVSGFRTAGDVGAFVGPITVGLAAQAWGYRAAFIIVAAAVGAAALVTAAARETAPSQQAVSRPPAV
jgi:MFS family permease